MSRRPSGDAGNVKDGLLIIVFIIGAVVWAVATGGDLP